MVIMIVTTIIIAITTLMRILIRTVIGAVVIIIAEVGARAIACLDVFYKAFLFCQAVALSALRAAFVPGLST